MLKRINNIFGCIRKNAADKQEDNHNLNSINNSNVGAEKPIVLRLQYGCIKEIRDI